MILLERSTVERAWALMQRGDDLKTAARKLAVGTSTLDRALWHWRARVTESNPTRGAANVRA
ncbi:MAG: hypothetical protein IOB84_07860 [Brevundimonas sp.]|nr:hypothetical protein [Brevundimonas sp.]